MFKAFNVRSPVFKNVALAAVLCVTTLVAGIAALMLAEFGAAAWIFALLFVWLLTVGLPTTSAVVLVASCWRGPSFSMFLLVAAMVAFAFQFAAVWAVRRRRSAVSQ